MGENGLEGRVRTWMRKDLGAGQKCDRQEWMRDRFFGLGGIRWSWVGGWQHELGIWGSKIDI